MLCGPACRLSRHAAGVCPEPSLAMALMVQTVLPTNCALWSHRIAPAQRVNGASGGYALSRGKEMH
jgi:hypothetical protein